MLRIPPRRIYAGVTLKPVDVTTDYGVRDECWDCFPDGDHTGVTPKSVDVTTDNLLPVCC